MTCAHHPGRAAAHHCAQRAEDLCDECAACPAPERYCRHRAGCLIWNRQESEGARAPARAPSSNA